MSVIVSYQSPEDFNSGVLTNGGVLSPTISFQFPQNVSTDALTNGGVASPLVSYQYLQNSGSEFLTNGSVNSAFVSYQFLQNFSSMALTNGGIMSPIASYNYFEWATGVLQLPGSPSVSYLYPGVEGPAIFLRGSVTDAGGAPLSGALVSVSYGILAVTQTNTDVNGNYSIPLGAGVYALTASATGHAKSSRVFTLSAATSVQVFQLALLPSTPVSVQVSRTPDVLYLTGPMGSTLKVFDGARFVAIDASNMPAPDRMTIVLTHGWARDPLCGTNDGINGWPTIMAAQLRANGVAPADANIVGWDWFNAANDCPLPPEQNTPSQGLALGQALRYALGPGYAQNLHFMGHSLGTLVNAAAANYLHGDCTAQQGASPTPWSPARTHMTLFDQAEVSRIASKQVVFDGLTLALENPEGIPALSALKFVSETLQGWKPSMPMRSAWADNYISLVGFYLPNTMNVALQKAEGIAALRAASETSNPLELAAKTLEYAHSYPTEWYAMSVATPPVSPLGFQQSWEYDLKMGLPTSTFPSALYQLGDAYHQNPSASDQLALEPLPPENVFQLIVPLFGNGADAVVQGVVGAINVVGEVKSEIKDAAAQTAAWINQGIDYAGNAALQGGQKVVNLYNTAVLRLTFHTKPPLPGAHANAFGPIPQDAGGSDSNSPAMAWLPIPIPTDAVAMAFDFTVEGDPVDDVLVCGIGVSNLFSLEAKFIPTNTMSASQLIDVSHWAGTTNELFFGLLGGTSTNATLTVENIRFYSLAQPTLEISLVGNTTVLSWPTTAGGYDLQTTDSLTPATWETVTNIPIISTGKYILTNSWSEQSRFFRLQPR